jgi:SAM-dependent methyltransferase
MWEGGKLFCVDRYITQDGRDISRFSHELRGAMDAIGKPWELVFMPSDEAAKLFEDGSLDFVYLDASHDYASVRSDLLSWYRKVRPGGIMAGHDYLDGTQKGPGQPVHRVWNPSQQMLDQITYGVFSAVNEFFKPLGLEITEIHEAYPTWVIQKPLSEKSSEVA